MASKSHSSSRSRRRKDQLSQSMKKIRSFAAIWHLFGKSLKHAIDALLSKEWQQEQSRQKLLKKIPKPLHRRVEALVAQVKEHEGRLMVALKAGMVDAGFALGPDKVTERFSALDVSEGRLGPGGGVLVFNLGHVGDAGKREWKEVDELEWEELLTTEIETRRHYVTEDRHHKEDEPGLWNLYARLTPWLAEVVGGKLESEGDLGKAMLQEVVVELAREFSQELGVDVIGAAVHREKDGDLHVHLIFSESREIPVPRKLPVREFEALVSGTTRQRMRDGDPRGFKDLRKVVKAELKTAGSDKDVVVEMQRRKWRRPVQVLGPAFSGKLALYLASGKDSALAAQGDRSADSSRSFRGRIVGMLERGEDLTRTCIDWWASERFRVKLEALLTKDELDRSKDLAGESVERYRLTGSQTPSVEELIAGEMARLAEGLPARLKKDLEARAAELDAREKEVSERERGVDQGLPAWVIALLERVPRRMKKKDPKDTLEGLVNLVEIVKDVRARVAKTLTKLETMKPKDWKALLMDLAEMLGVRVPKKKTMEGPQM